MQIAPAHYPCGTGAGQNMQVMPNVGWANAVPDSQGTVKLDIGGSKLDFTGPGYHDKVSDQILDRFGGSVGSDIVSRTGA